MQNEENNNVERNRQPFANDGRNVPASGCCDPNAGSPVGASVDDHLKRSVQLQRLAKKHPVLAQTLVDLDACAAIFRKTVNKQTEAAKEAPVVEQIPPVEAHKRASTCSAMWDEMSGADRFRLCSQCKLYMYDFTGLTREEAQKSVYQREGTEGEIQFFKRLDNRYLTKDCPIGMQAKRARTKTFAVVGALVLSGIAASLYFWMQYKPAQQAPVNAAVADSSSFSSQRSAVANLTGGGHNGVSSGTASSGTNSGATTTAGAGVAAVPLGVPQKDGQPIDLNGNPIPRGSRYATKFTRFEFVRGAPSNVVNIPLSNQGGR